MKYTIGTTIIIETEAFGYIKGWVHDLHPVSNKTEEDIYGVIAAGRLFTAMEYHLHTIH